jgi:cobyrinic acid a,c-diamide synthase
MDAPTTKWWDGWKRKQERATGVVIELWDETELRRLLIFPDAENVRRHYYEPAGQTTGPGAAVVHLAEEDADRLETALFVRQLREAGHVEIAASKEQFFNAELMAREIVDKGVPSEVAALSSAEAVIRGLWEDHFNDACQACEGARLPGLHQFNKTASEGHERLLREAADATGIPVFGVIRRRDQLTVPSRHLGLIPAAELGSPAADAVTALTSIAAGSVDLDAVVRLARTAGPLQEDADISSERTVPSLPRPRIAFAGGPAFTFGYAEHPELLDAAGAEVVRFDPLRDEQLPDGVDGLVIGGGFPEEHAADLSANVPLQGQVAALARAGAPVIAECAGLLYLARSLDGHPMYGVLDASAAMTGRLTLGYRDAVAAAPSPLAQAGTRVHGHEFHRTTVQSPDWATAAWHWRRSGAPVTEGFVRGGVHASYLHALERHPRRGRPHHRRRPCLPRGPQS